MTGVLNIGLGLNLYKQVVELKRTALILSFLVVGASLSGCGGSSSNESALFPTPPPTATPTQEPHDPFATINFADIEPVNTNSSYVSVLKPCVLAESSNDFCSLAKLPIMGLESDTLSVDDVMARVLVSHQWQADNFRLLLESYPVELLALFKGLTAVVIDADIRPSHYRTETGAIYLDPGYLWTTVAHKETISKAEDYRAGFADPLAFRTLSRYTKDDNYVYNYGSLNDNSTRTLGDISLLLARLLLHELAHVNDFMPLDRYSDLDTSLNVDGAILSLGLGATISDQLYDFVPLTSSLLMDLAEVMFFGRTPTTAEKAISASNVSTAFSNDSASDDYAYSNQYEDLAMLFEAAMMKYFWDVDYDLAITGKPSNDGYYCNDYVIRWGVRNRLGDAAVGARAKFVTDALMPNLDMDDFYNNLEEPRYMLAGSDWCLPTIFSETGAGLQKVQRSDTSSLSTIEKVERPIPIDDLGKPH